MKTHKKILALLLAIVMFATGLCIAAPEAKEVEATGATISDELLQVKIQARQAKTGGYDIRVCFGIDNLEDYAAVGFDVYVNDEQVLDPKTNAPFQTDTVKRRLNATTNFGAAYQYSPKVISTDAEYFALLTIQNIEKDKDKVYIKPFVVFNDNTTTQYGVGRCFTMADYYNAQVINIPIESSTNPGDTMNVYVGDETEARVATILEYDTEKGYAHVNIPVTDRTTYPSVTPIKTATDKIVASYRNLVSTGTDSTWYDADKTDFIVANEADMRGLASLVNSGDALSDKTIYLVSDVAFTTTWTSIGSASGKPFRGTFDGQEHTISGMTGTGGMFGYSYGEIRNFTLESATITSSSNYTGSIINVCKGGELSNVYADENVTLNSTHQMPGGLIGDCVPDSNTIVTISNCGFEGTVTNTAQNTSGGLVARAKTGTVKIEDCYFGGTVTSSANKLGGILGNATSSVTVLITNSLSVGDVIYNGTNDSGTSTSMGAIVSQVDSGSKVTLQNVYMKDAFKTTGGIDGIGSASGTLLADTIYGTTHLLEAPCTGTDVWKTMNLDFYSKYNTDGTWAIMSNGLPQLKQFAKETEDNKVVTTDYTTTDTTKISSVDNFKDWYYAQTMCNGVSGDVTSGDVFTLYTELDWITFANVVNEGNKFTNCTINLGSDIDFAPGWKANGTSSTIPYNGYSVPVITSFSGNFNGQNNTVKGIYINSTSSTQGVFGTTTKTVENTLFKNSYIAGNNYIGIIATMTAGTVQNIHVSDDVTIYGAQHTGGVVGRVNTTATNGVQVSNCSFAGNVIANTSNGGKGGIVGNVAKGTVTIDSCIYTGYIDGTGAATTGGILGMINKTYSATIDNCTSTGTYFNSNYGKLVGKLYSGATLTLSGITQETYDEKYICVNDGGTIYGDGGVEITLEAEPAE